MLSHGYAKYARKLEEHRDDGIEICCAVQGEFSWSVEGHQVTIRKKEVSVTMPWQIHSGFEGTINRGDLAFIIIRPKRLTRDGDLLLGKWSRLPLDFQRNIGKQLVGLKSPAIGHVPGLLECLDAMGHEMLQKKECHEIRVHALMDEIFIRLGRHLKSPVTTNEAVPFGIQKAVSEIENDITRAWSLRELKIIARYRGTSFTQYFKQLTGLSPHQYIISRRIALAKEKLRQKDCSLTRIAYELNFSSAQHFSGAFRKWTGDSPRNYRKEHASL